jgi:hypothetical protein
MYTQLLLYELNTISQQTTVKMDEGSIGNSSGKGCDKEVQLKTNRE